MIKSLLGKKYIYFYQIFFESLFQWFEMSLNEILNKVLVKLLNSISELTQFAKKLPLKKKTLKT